MTHLETVDADDLREWLEHVETRDSTQFLMLGIAYEQGISPADLARWYDLSEEDVSDWIAEFDSRPLVISIAIREGVDIDALADASGVNPQTIHDWFASLESRPIASAADVVRRYAQQSPGPLLGGADSRVVYLNYEVIEERGWSVEDADLFEKASNANLDVEDYGRFLVESGETILEAAENRGQSWPYACRGGACANCAVIVTDGDIAMPGQTVLSDDQVRHMNARLACVGVPATEEVRLVFNVQRIEQFEELRLPSPMTDSKPLL